MPSTLNRPSKTKKSSFIVPIAKLPTRIIHIDFKPDRQIEEGKPSSINLILI